jgi:hypothetical protein
MFNGCPAISALTALIIPKTPPTTGTLKFTPTLFIVCAGISILEFAFTVASLFPLYLAVRSTELIVAVISLLFSHLQYPQPVFSLHLSI